MTDQPPVSRIPNVDKAGLDALLPDEDPKEFKAFRDELLEELKPQTAYQSHLAINLILIEWEITRHRRMVASVVRDEFRRQTFGVRKYGAPGKTKTYTAAADDVDDGSALLAGDKAISGLLSQKGVTKSEITAAAMSARLDNIGYHEGRISDLERRRRYLKDDYEKLKAKKPPAADIEDAVEVP